MATVGEIRQAVLEKTRRFDQQDGILREVIRSVRMIHGMELWDKDSTDVRLIPEYENSNSTEFRLDVPENFRAPNMFIPVFTGNIRSAAPLPKILEVISAEAVRRIKLEGKTAQNNSVFRHGDKFVGYCLNRPDFVDLAYWAKPIITDAESSTWVTRDHEDVVFHRACAAIYGDNGHKEKAQEHAGLFTLAMQILRSEERTK